MDKVQWVMDNWVMLTGIAGSAYILFDMVIRLVVSDAMVQKVEAKLGALGPIATKAYEIAKTIMSFNRVGKK